MSSAKVSIEFEAYTFIDIEVIEGEPRVIVELMDKECEESYFTKTVNLTDMVNKYLEYAEPHELDKLSNTLYELAGIVQATRDTIVHDNFSTEGESHCAKDTTNE